MCTALVSYGHYHGLALALHFPMCLFVKPKKIKFDVEKLHVETS